MAVPNAEAKAVAECGNYNPNNKAASNSAHGAVHDLDESLSWLQMQQATSTAEDTRRQEIARRKRLAMEGARLGAMVAAEAMEARRQQTEPKSDCGGDWQQGDVQEKLRRDGYGNFTAVMVVDEKLIIHCIYCGENIDASEEQRGLCDFETHLMTDKHLRNVQKEYEAEISGVTDAHYDQQAVVHPPADSPPGVFVDNASAAPHLPPFRLPPFRWDSGASCLSAKVQSCQKSGQKDAPYRWQMWNDATGAWTDMADRETLEVTYCQVENEKCSVMHLKSFGDCMESMEKGELNFKDDNTMTLTFRDSNRTMPVRRLEMASPHVTKWKWYWLDVNKKWVEYGSQSDKNVTSNATAEDIENAFLAHPKGHFRFTTNEGQNYDLDFARMVQRNLHYNTERKVRRRPEYSVWTEDSTKHERALEKKKDKTLNASYTPDYWDIQADGERVKYVKLDSNRCGKTSQEYQRIEALFKGTMQWTRVTSIKRVQSLEVFDAYDRKKTWMMKDDKKDPKELHLFHGTAASNIKTICEQGFDWRISGCSTGTKYGKGSYFGVTAEVASKYAKNVMFVCKVLVGESCQGNSSYVRPPPKDPRYPNENLYDSCVDNIRNPTMYIIFKSEQAYPEYIIEYEFVQNGFGYW